MYIDFAVYSVAGFLLLIGGMKLTESALDRWAGNRLSAWLSRATSTPLRGFLFGTIAAAGLQSSTAVTVLTIGFVNAGWITLSQSFGIILGMNVGTTLTTEMLSWQLHRYGWFILGGAFAGWLWSAMQSEMKSGGLPRGRMAALRYGSVALAGFGFLLIGFQMLVGMGNLLQQNEFLASIMEKSGTNPAFGLLGGAVLTAVIHSSAAVIGIVMAAAGSGAMPLETGLAVVLGANIGTCFTGLVASLGGGMGGRFVALTQLALNAAGVLLFLPLLPLLQATVEWLDPSDRYAQIAHAQTLFNVVCSLVALPLAYWPGWRTPK